MSCSSKKSDIAHTANVISIAESFVGLVVCILHHAILMHVSLCQKKKGFDLQLALSTCAILSLLGWIVYFASWLEWLPETYFVLQMSAYVTPWFTNGMFASYGYLVVAICLDRYIVLARPVFYMSVCSRRKMHAFLIVASVAIGITATSKWFGKYTIVAGANHSGWPVCAEAEPYFTQKQEWQIFCTILQFYIAPAIMIGLSILTVRQLRHIRKQYVSVLRVNGPIRQRRLRDDKVTTRLCVTLAVVYTVTNVPMSVSEYNLKHENLTKDGWVIFILVTNIWQLASIEVNLLLYACCCGVYRKTLIKLVSGSFCKARNRVAPLSRSFLPTITESNSRTSTKLLVAPDIEFVYPGIV